MMVDDKNLICSGATESALTLLENIKQSLGDAKNWKKLASTLARKSEEAITRRPTSALLINTLRELMIKAIDLYRAGDPLERAVEELRGYINLQRERTISSTEKLSEIGARRLPPDCRVLVHSYSTSVLKILKKAADRNRVKEVYATESRPGGEGILMAKKISELGIQVNLIVDSAANYFMDKIDLVLLGAEAITANGALVNKVGSSLISLAAYHKRTRVLVAAGTYKFSFETLLGEIIRIPEAPLEMLDVPRELMEMGVIVKAPLMDVTPPNYIDAIVTEEGVTSPQGVPIIIWEKYGKWPYSQPDLHNLIAELRRIGDAQ